MTPKIHVGESHLMIKSMAECLELMEAQFFSCMREKLSQKLPQDITLFESFKNTTHGITKPPLLYILKSPAKNAMKLGSKGQINQDQKTETNEQIKQTDQQCVSSLT